MTGLRAKPALGATRRTVFISLAESRTDMTAQWLSREVEYVGVDFSGGAAAGRNIWIARTRPRGRRLKLIDLDCLEALCGCADRAAALAHLRSLIGGSQAVVWAIDFPFGLPVELSAMGPDWPAQLAFHRGWVGDAKSFGLWCVGQTRELTGKLHVRRSTDQETRTPFDCYHYRIIYQTFHGMRDVLEPLSGDVQTAVLPFQQDRMPGARRVVVEACPSSTLKRLKLPHQNYKQPAGGALAPKRVRTRRAILAGFEELIDIDAGQQRKIMRNAGGDALDAVIAAVGAWQSLSSVDHEAIQRHPRYRREGFVYA